MVDRRLIWFVALLLPVLAWSAMRPHDYFTWFLEVAPVLIGVPVMFAVQRRFPLSTLLLILLWLHCVVLVVGAHYTYARVPLGDWAMNWFGWSRNNYDKIGHFVQGLVPAILAREIFLRASPLGTGGLGGRPSRWLPFLVGSVCLAFSALYELIEWLTALSTGEAAEDFLGTQGDPWDTQTDMALALIGAVCAIVLLSRMHDRAIQRLTGRNLTTTTSSKSGSNENITS
jgi:putative membrane protein